MTNMAIIVACRVLLLSLGALTLPALALEPLSDPELSSQDGGAIGMVLSNYSLNVDPAGTAPDGNTYSGTWTVRGGPVGNPFNLVFSNFYWQPSAGSGGQIGSVSDPVYFLADRIARMGQAGSNVTRTLLTLGAPQSSVGNKFDTYYKMSLDTDAATMGAGHGDAIDLLAQGADIDKSWLSIYAEPNQSTPGFALIAQLDFHAARLILDTNYSSTFVASGTAPLQPARGFTTYGQLKIGGCNDTGASGCDTSPRNTGDSDYREDWLFTASYNGTSVTRAQLNSGFSFEYHIGNALYQPVMIQSYADGNFGLELVAIPNTANVYNQFYSNSANANTGLTDKGNLSWGSLISDAGTYTWNGATQNMLGDLGYSAIEGIRIQHFKIVTRGL